MTPSLVATILDALPSRKGVLLLVPAILLVAPTLAIGQNDGDAAHAAAAHAAPCRPARPAAQDSTVVGRARSRRASARRSRRIIKDYLLNNPEIMLEAQNALEAKMDKIQAERMAVAVKEQRRRALPARRLARSSAMPRATCPMIEFFDYNCGYCKKAFGDVAKLIEKDKKVQLILKEFPILSQGLRGGVTVALAAKMQGKYWEFHRAMLESQGQANEASALRVAEKLGLDMARLKKDMASAEVKKEIDETRELATKMGIQGTPHFIVGDRIIPGAPENLPSCWASTSPTCARTAARSAERPALRPVGGGQGRNRLWRTSPAPFHGPRKADKRARGPKACGFPRRFPDSATFTTRRPDVQADLRAQRTDLEAARRSHAFQELARKGRRTAHG